MASSAGARRQNIEPSEKEEANEEAWAVLKELLRLSRKDRTVPYDHVLDTVCQLTEHTVNTADRTLLFQVRETLREKLLFYVTLARHKDIRTVFNNIRNYAQSENPDLEVPSELKPDNPDEWEAFKIEQSAKLQQVPIQQEYAVTPEVVPANEPEQEPEDVPVNEPVEEPAQGPEDPTGHELRAIRDVLKMPHLIEWDEDNKEDLLTVLKKYQPDEWRAVPNELSMLEKEEKPAAAEVTFELASSDINPSEHEEASLHRQESDNSASEQVAEEAEQVTTHGVTAAEKNVTHCMTEDDAMRTRIQGVEKLPGEPPPHEHLGEPPPHRI